MAELLVPGGWVPALRCAAVPASQFSLFLNSQAARVVYLFSLGLSLGCTMAAGAIQPEQVLLFCGCCGLAVLWLRGPVLCALFALLTLSAGSPWRHPRDRAFLRLARLTGQL